MSVCWMAVLAILLTAVPLWGSWSAAGEIVDLNVTGFAASPSFINLGFNTSISVEIGTSYGAGLDNYRVTVTAPDSAAWSKWFNFTAVGSMAELFGDNTTGFMTDVDQVGLYDLYLEYFDGTVFTPAAYAQFSTTDVLTVVPAPHAPANTWTEGHTCPITNEFERGNSVMMRANVYYLSNGEVIPRNMTVTQATMDIPGVSLYDPLADDYSSLTDMYLGHGGFSLQKRVVIPWDSPVGSFYAYLNVTDIYGNSGEGSVRLNFKAARLDVHVQTFNGTVAQSFFEVDDTVSFVINATYKDRGKTHGYIYHGPDDWGYMPMDTTRGGEVTVRLGSGYDPTTGTFAQDIATVTLTYDSNTEMWLGSYVVTAEDGDVTAVVEAMDAAPGVPNTGYAFMELGFVQTLTETVTVEVPIEVPVNVYHNETIKESTGFEMPLVGGIAAIMLVVGLGVGMVLFRRKKKNGSASPKTDEGDGEGGL